jgi:two-component system chemotaxis response regulator CheB
MCKILIADDSALFRRSLRTCLEQNPKLRVCGEAEDGRAAIDKVKELRPDVVILDWQMPVMDGIKAARHITRIAPEATVALLTLHSGPQITKKAQAIGIQRVFSKADRLEYLSEWLMQVCERAVMAVT